MSTPNNRARPSIGQPQRIARMREQSPGGASVGSLEDESINRPGTTPRQSMSVRSNAAGRNSRDPRPVGDKIYASQCAHNVVDFLHTHGFGRTVSYEKFLREPMSKDFFDIFKFLMAQIDPQLEINGKIEDEVPLIMRRLKYPVEVNKSKLQSICGPNTWPQLLAVLDWLIALIQVNDGLIEPVAECRMGLDDIDGGETDFHLLRTLHENYLEFLGGKDDNTVEERLRQIYEERIESVQMEVDRLQEQMTGMDTQLQEFQSEHNRLLEIQAAPRQLEIEADRLRGVIQSQDARAQRAEEETVVVEAEDASVMADVETLEQKQKELQEQVESQAYSKRDIERLKYERNHLRRMLEDLKADAEKTEQGVWELGIEEQRLEESISRACRYVNDKAEALETVVSSSGGPSGQDLCVRVDLSEPTDALADMNFDEQRAHVDAAADAQREATRVEDSKVHEVSEDQRTVQEESSEKEREVRRLKTRLEQLTRMREEYRVWSDQQLDEARQTAEAIEDAVRAGSIATAAPTHRELAEVDELRLRLSELKSKCEGDRTFMEENIRREQELKEQHKLDVQKEMQLALESMDQLREDVEKKVAELGSVDLDLPARRGGC